MAIKPIEKTNRGLLIKAIFISFLILISAIFGFFIKKKSQDIPSVLGEVEKKNDLIVDSVDKAKKIGGEVLGETASFVQDLTSKAASTASDLIYQNTIGKLINQIDKLPQDQQERVKEQICK